MSKRDCIALLQWALPRLTHRWEGYRRVRCQICRCIAARIQALGLPDLAAYRTRLEEDPAVWTFALQSHWPGLRLSILVTDIDAGMPRRAEMACYPLMQSQGSPPDWLGSAFVRDNGHFCHRPELCVPVRFLRQDLCEELSDGSFHLILCRNLAFIYFAESLQQEITRGLMERLIPGWRQPLWDRGNDGLTAIPGLRGGIAAGPSPLFLLRCQEGGKAFYGVWHEIRHEVTKVKICGRVEHLFHVIKNIFKHKKARYQGLTKNDAQLNILLAMSSLYLVKEKLCP